MEIITAYPILYVTSKKGKSIKDASLATDLSFDGKKATSTQVADFQKFANSKGYTPKLVVDGKYGANTQKAIDAWGTEFDKFQSFIHEDSGVIRPNTSQVDKPIPAPVKSQAQIDKEVSALIPDAKSEKKGMSVGMKIGIAVGAVTIVGVIIYAVTKKRN